MDRPEEPSFGGPGGPRAGRGRSHDKQRNLELSREARTAPVLSLLLLLLLVVVVELRPPGGQSLMLPPFETRATSLLSFGVEWVWREHDGWGGAGPF